MELTNDEKEKLMIELAKIMAQRIDMVGIKKMIAKMIFDDIKSQIDFNFLAEQTIRTYKNSTKIRLGHQADRSLYELFCDISKRITKIEIAKLN